MGLSRPRNEGRKEGGKETKKQRKEEKERKKTNRSSEARDTPPLSKRCVIGIPGEEEKKEKECSKK